ncbi:Cof-type HAD-IIB family hydrolase [Vibrio fluvialis]|uniref:Cof-type HAD-IIB family hydrolase n=1 Tax=Vibrio fluvialis TaxID=676 RepID=UPI00096BBE09|nr:Cof-type HAD-IIB family hydrolase [Vibrio fluvialis]EKO3964138.1 HAD family hydrolase [Vibrio fluvialis]ELL7086303.1 HAD family hydrolase [Vibrio fluvialis]ELV8763492.1 HAD family hydrolase [Vibrio fluvialis]EMA8958270.1 HAD family hydrolase [Vibrio fluvialis]EMA8960242.1 HAD family hydrolase [Vibrio fluvialis]
MSQRNIKFIATDMDGTLLDEKGQLDPEFFPLHKQLDERGILFAAASGRQYYSLLDTFAEIQDRIMFIAENGTLVMYKGEELYSSTIDKSAVAAIINEARNIAGTHVVLCGKRSAYIETEDPQAMEEIQKYYHRCESVSDLLAVEDDFIKVAICHFDGTEQWVNPSINAKFGHSHKVVVSAKIWLDVMNAEASKGTAIKQLQAKFDFTEQETMTFGDYFNDVEMLQASYYSYAVDNAHEQVKTYARFRAPSNREGGVLTIIKQLLNQA